MPNSEPWYYGENVDGSDMHLTEKEYHKRYPNAEEKKKLRWRIYALLFLNKSEIYWWLLFMIVLIIPLAIVVL